MRWGERLILNVIPVLFLKLHFRSQFTYWLAWVSYILWYKPLCCTRSEWDPVSVILPLSQTNILCAYLVLESLWEIKREVLPFVSESMYLKISYSLFGSSAAVGSSIITNCPPCAMLLARAIFWD